MDAEGPRDGGDINSTAYVGNESFSEEKLKEYCWLPEMKKRDRLTGTSVYAYIAHNVDIYFQASFLECWVRNYLNEAMKKVLK